ncbi:head-tail connector protein [Polymorphobacter fuscus]|uniref:Phage gp6-like head-tail connector protein n=1 Tax=Sandarakinorhabdus fusca TaxID=1439888 RepID=A0A7C9KGM8_9SPHN|nr:head-tail connector protein [Polymorphobacter fuscus]KAB7648181.1 hypothetical protein F9290_00165 [Polymorphobacter fuscus]MQT15679.1 hypothetical protein [Polymorphobacter fuscus]NJC08050.1 putative phiE125 gp8 family phage protein [Polymorphobacter fuscus]
MATTTMALGPLAVSLGECKAYLRLERDDEDGVLAGLIRTATALCEAFTGQWLIIRDAELRLAALGGWQRLGVVPVAAITGVAGAAGFDSAIDADGTGWVRLTGAIPSQPVAAVRAGLAADWNGIPEPLRQGIIRLVAHLHAHRDAADAGPPPAAVAALWRPWRRLRLL